MRQSRAPRNSENSLLSLISSWLYPAEPANLKRHHEAPKAELQEEPKKKEALQPRSGLRIKPGARERQQQRLQHHYEQQQGSQQLRGPSGHGQAQPAFDSAATSASALNAHAVPVSTPSTDVSPSQHQAWQQSSTVCAHASSPAGRSVEPKGASLPAGSPVKHQEASPPADSCVEHKEGAQAAVGDASQSGSRVGQADAGDGKLVWRGCAQALERLQHMQEEIARQQELLMRHLDCPSCGRFDECIGSTCVVASRSSSSRQRQGSTGHGRFKNASISYEHMEKGRLDAHGMRARSIGRAEQQWREKVACFASHVHAQQQLQWELAFLIMRAQQQSAQLQQQQPQQHPPTGSAGPRASASSQHSSHHGFSQAEHSNQEAVPGTVLCSQAMQNTEPPGEQNLSASRVPRSPPHLALCSPPGAEVTLQSQHVPTKAQQQEELQQLQGEPQQQGELQQQQQQRREEGMQHEQSIPISEHRQAQVEHQQGEQEQQMRAHCSHRLQGQQQLQHEQCAAFQILISEHAQLEAECEELRAKVLSLTEDLTHAHQEAETGVSATQQLQQVLCALDSSLNDLHTEHTETKAALAAVEAENSHLLTMIAAMREDGRTLLWRRLEGTSRGMQLPSPGRASAPVASN